MRTIILGSLLLWTLGSLPVAAQETPPEEAPENEPAPGAPANPPANEAPADEAPKVERRRAAPPEVFEEGLGDYYSDDFVSAAAAMHDYIATNEDTAVNYEWAQYFLGVSLQRLGFTHAASEYLYNVAKNRTRPEILPEALTRIEEIMQGPHDEILLQEKLLTDSEFGYLPQYVADFVNYYKGLEDLRAGRVKWAEILFEDITDESRYKAKSIYALGVQRLRRNRVTDAVKNFRVALEHPTADRDLRNQTRLALARVLYEKERYKAARKLYDTVEVPELTTAEASLYLEKAWTSYWLKDYRRTMGILYALEAPSYRDYFAPEKFLLRALVYKNLCHYIPSKRELRRFRFRFDQTLQDIRDRIDLRDSDVLRTAALGKDALGRLAAFRRQLADEADRIDTIGGDWVVVQLDDQLRRVYELKIQQTDLKLGADLEKATRQIAEELVDFEEQMYLLDYEVGLAIYRRLRRENARRPTEEDDLSVPSGGDEAYFSFNDEFWNDELPDYDFFVENRCFDEGGTEQ